MKKLTRSPILQEIYHFLLEQQPTYGCPITSEVISQQLNLTPSYVREQMKWLIEERKIAVRRGAKGGYYIVKNDQITFVVDGQEKYYPLGTFVETYHQSLLQIEKEQKVITALNIDGVPLRNIQDYNGSWSDISKIEIDTKPIQELISESIQDAQEYLPRLYEALISVSDSIQRGFEGEAMIVLQQIVEGLEWFSAYVQGITHYGAKYGATVDQSDTIHELVNIYNNLTEAMESRDFVWIADITAYELAPFVERWITITDQLLNVA